MITLTQILNLGDDARRRAILRPKLLVCVRDKPSDGPHVLRLSHKRSRHEVHVVLDPVAIREGAHPQHGRGAGEFSELFTS